MNNTILPISKNTAESSNDTDSHNETVPNTLSRRLWLDFGSIILIFLISNLVSTYFLFQIESNIKAIASIEDPMNEAVLEMEINAGETAQAIYDYVNHQDPRSIKKLKDAEKDFERYASNLQTLARDKSLIVLSTKVNDHYSRLKDIGSEIIQLVDQRHKSLTHLHTLINSVIHMIDDQLLEIADHKSDTLQITLRTENIALKTFLSIKGYILNAKSEQIKTTTIFEAKFIESLELLARGNPNSEKLTRLKDIKTEFQRAMSIGNQVTHATNKIDNLLIQFETELLEIDSLLDDVIQPQIMENIRKVEMDTVELTMVMLVTKWSLALISTLFAIFITLRLGKKITNSMVVLVEGARKIGEGNVESRINLNTNDEFSYLGDTFNRTMNRLMSAQQEARRNQQKTQAILDTAADGIISMTSRGIVTSINRTAEQMFGYSPDQVIGHNIKMLMPNPYSREHDGYLADYQNTGIKKIIGIGREVSGLRKDGAVFPMDLAVSEIIEKGRLPGADDVVSYTGIVRDISERKKVDLAKAEFVSTVSHELRTPLTSIKGALGMAVTGKIGDLSPKLKGMLDIAYKNTNRLVLLINDMLDMEKITADKLEFDMKKMDATVLISDAIEANKGYADQYEVTFIQLNPEQQFYIKGDYHRLMQVMANLMSNAAKFSPIGERIELSTQKHGSMIRIMVKDYGEGIPENYKGSIFDKFSQADSTDTKQKGGTGLGLSIAKAFVEKHGGDLNFDTETGKGTTFYFDLPELPEQLVEPVPSSSQKKLPHVLICEDDSDITNLLEIMIGSTGFITSSVSTIRQAKQMLKENKYDAMTLDLDLPDGDGLDMIRDFKQLPKTKDLPVIVVAANANERELTQSNDNMTQIFAWLQKPIELELLIRSLRKAVNAKPQILHLEDDDSILSVVSSLIGGSANITTAKTIKQAETLLQHEVFDLVILDLTLPDGDAEDLLPLVRKPGWPSAPVIIFSAKEISPENLKHIHKGIVKTLATNEDLLEVIQSALNTEITQR